MSIPSDGRRVKVAVVGAGLMGHGIAQAFMVTNFDVSIWDPDRTTRDNVKTRIREHLNLLCDSSPVTLTVCDSLEQCVQECDFVVEAVPENLELKRDLISKIDEINPCCVIGTNTSVLRITEIAANSRDPSRIVGTHWWNPPYLIPIVEVVRGNQTSELVACQVKEWLTAAEKVAVDVFKDVPGFVGNRMQFALLREAMHIVDEGICSSETVDLVASQTFGRRLSVVGPLRNADFIGLDLVEAIMDYLLPSLTDSKDTPRLIKQQLKAGKLGAKAGGGIFRWEAGERDSVENRLLEHLLRANQAY
jgi:3-hydroxybutyryl-CoA dehydrogenase